MQAVRRAGRRGALRLPQESRQESVGRHVVRCPAWAPGCRGTRCVERGQASSFWGRSQACVPRSTHSGYSCVSTHEYPGWVLLRPRTRGVGVSLASVIPGKHASAVRRCAAALKWQADSLHVFRGSPRRRGTSFCRAAGRLHPARVCRAATINGPSYPCPREI